MSGSVISRGYPGDTTLTTGGIAQYLFNGNIPLNGYGVYNPDPINDLWLSSTVVAAINGEGSIRVAANGGGYETPTLDHPYGPVSVIGAVTGQFITARAW